MTSARRTASSQARKLTQSFFRRPAADAAQELIGKILVRRIAGKLFGPVSSRLRLTWVRRPRVTRIEGTNAANRSSLRSPGGCVRVPDLRHARDAQRRRRCRGPRSGVLIRAADPLDDWNVNLSGPAVTRALQITRLKTALISRERNFTSWTILSINRSFKLQNESASATRLNGRIRPSLC